MEMLNGIVPAKKRFLRRPRLGGAFVAAPKEIKP
jgi:hypothetical protein